MDGSANEQQPDAEVRPAAVEAKRERSSIGFPYMTLVEAMEVADAIHGHVGNGSCDDHQLAPWLSVSHKSSGYRLRVSAAKTFGLIDSADKNYKLSALGKKIVDRAQRDRAKADAFLEVPLFGAVYERFRGTALPPPAALEREFAELGVAKKQTGKARSSFERSAKAAGYFDEGTDRLVKPGFAESDPAPERVPPEPDKKPKFGGGNTGEGGGGGRHPFIEGLLQTLPDPNTVWSVEGRVAWLKAAATCFDLMYQGEGAITVEGRAVETKTAEDIL